MLMLLLRSRTFVFVCAFELVDEGCGASRAIAAVIVVVGGVDLAVEVGLTAPAVVNEEDAELKPVIPVIPVVLTPAVLTGGDNDNDGDDRRRGASRCPRLVL